MKPETNFILSVHRYLDKSKVYYEKMNNPFRGGTPDVYYEGSKEAIWVEYKYIPKLPKTKLYKPRISPLQKRWLLRAFQNKRPVYLISGIGKKAYIHSPLEFVFNEIGFSPSELDFISKKELAAWITKQCT